MRMLITGAAGRIGSEIVKDLSRSHDLCLLDRKLVPGYESIIADCGTYPTGSESTPCREIESLRWTDAFKGAEIVIHLAEDRSPQATWRRVLHSNIQATWNVLQAAVEHKVRRVVYASSTWAVKALEWELAPACYEPNGPKIGSDVQPRPIAPYGIAKACGEITGRALVDEKKLSSFLAVRIGWYDPNPSEIEDYHRLAIGAEDLRSLFQCCGEAEFEGFQVVYGISAQQISPYDLYHTCRLLSWEPRQLP
ncbi:MAG: NAD-dependent epimerase/dehydratase family protein [Thermodesulfobacteriota bacterium]